MSAAFPRTLRWLSRESSGRSWWMPLAVAVLLVGWVAWALLARVTVYAVSDSARLEVEQAACPIEAPVDGRVRATHIVLGADVQAGDALLELDSEPFRLEMNELLARRDGSSAELRPLEDEIRAQEEQLESLRHATPLGIEELAAQLREEEAALRLAEDVVRRSTQLRSDGVVAQLDLDKAQFEVAKHKAGVERSRAAKDRLDWDRRAQASELQGKLEESRHEKTRVQGEIAVAVASIEKLQNEIERRTIRAPVAGRLGETANVRAGQFVEKGSRLGAIVPGGELKIVAAFRPQDALGRLRLGQAARFRLHGFPWVQYGSVSARVTSLASEVLSGSARVEASVAREPRFPVELQHGLPGSLEIEIERVSPATLVLRASGAFLAGRSARTDAADGSAEGK